MAVPGERLAFVTGAGSGIGRATAIRLARDGLVVVATDLRLGLAQETASVIGPSAHALALDVRDEAAWERAFTALPSLPLSVLVNAAGITGFGASPGGQDPESLTLETLRAVLAVNLEGVVLGCRHGIRAMRETGGSIVNVASRAGTIGVPGAVAYAASKAAVLSVSRSVALHCAGAAWAPPGSSTPPTTRSASVICSAIAAEVESTVSTAPPKTSSR